MNAAEQLREKRDRMRTTEYRRVTAAEVRQHGICKGKHKGLGQWRLFCGCMEHPPGTSVVRLLGDWVWRIVREETMGEFVDRKAAGVVHDQGGEA